MGGDFLHSFPAQEWQGFRRQHRSTLWFEGMGMTRKTDYVSDNGRMEPFQFTITGKVDYTGNHRKDVSAPKWAVPK